MKIATHDKTGNVYLVLDEVPDATNSREGEFVIIYQDLKGHKYVRAVKEFYAKFTIRDSSDIKYVDRRE